MTLTLVTLGAATSGRLEDGATLLFHRTRASDAVDYTLAASGVRGNYTSSRLHADYNRSIPLPLCGTPRTRRKALVANMFVSSHVTMETFILIM